MDLKTVREGFALMEQGMRKLNGGPLDYYVTRLMDCYELLLDKYAPFKVGDRVVLTETPYIESESGWYSSKHFLVKGAEGIVREVAANRNGFNAGVEFLNQSWIPTSDSLSQGIIKGVPVPLKEPYIYHFNEKYLVKVPT